MTNAPESRKTHVIRIFGTNRNDELLDHIWADVERMNVVKSGLGGEDGVQWQGHQRKLKWCDDPNADDYEPDGNPARKEELVKICDPSVDGQNFDDPDEWIPIRKITVMKMAGSQNNYEGIQEKFNNTVENESRVVEARRILHYDTNIDDDAQAAADGGQKVYVVTGDQYQRDDGTKDDQQYVEHEIITYVKQGGNNVKEYRPGDQNRQVKLLNQYLIDESDPAQMTEVGTTGIDPPYRLDPYQNIVNIQFVQKVYVVIVAANGDYAEANADGVDIIERRSFTFAGEIFSLSGTLIECQANIGDNFLKISTSIDQSPRGPEAIYCFVCPKTDEIKDNWFDLFVRAIPAGNVDRYGLPLAPFLWVLYPINVGRPLTMNFTLDFVPHLTSPVPGAVNRMVQMYPINGANVWTGAGSPGTVTVGYSILAYRTDKKGTGQIYGTQQPGHPWHLPISFTAPPLISADIPIG